MSCWRSQNSWLRTRRTLHSTSLTQTGTTLGSILRGRCESWTQRTSLWSTNWPLKPVSVYKFSAVVERILFDRENILQDAGGVCRMFIYMLVSRCTLQTTSFQMSCSQHWLIVVNLTVLPVSLSVLKGLGEGVGRWQWRVLSVSKLGRKPETSQ